MNLLINIRKKGKYYVEFNYLIFRITQSVRPYMIFYRTDRKGHAQTNAPWEFHKHLYDLIELYISVIETYFLKIFVFWFTNSLKDIA